MELTIKDMLSIVVELARVVICVGILCNQSESRIQVTWYKPTNQRAAVAILDGRGLGPSLGAVLIWAFGGRQRICV